MQQPRRSERIANAEGMLMVRPAMRPDRAPAVQQRKTSSSRTPNEGQGKPFDPRLLECNPNASLDVLARATRIRQKKEEQENDTEEQDEGKTRQKANEDRHNRKLKYRLRNTATPPVPRLLGPAIGRPPITPSLPPRPRQSTQHANNGGQSNGGQSAPQNAPSGPLPRRATLTLRTTHRPRPSQSR